MPTPAKFAIALILAVGMFVAGYMANRQAAPAASSSSTKQVLYYTCPMHPQYRSDRPGDAPCCGMRLEPVYAGNAATTLANSAAPAIPGTVQVSGARQQLIGVETAEVQRTSSSHLLRLPGRIALDESRLYRLIAAADGWIRDLGQNPAGTFVRKDQTLTSYYTRDLVASQQGFLYALQTINSPQRGPAGTNLQLAIDSLRSMGMGDLQIKELQEARTAASQINIYSPVTGYVIARNVSPGQWFEKGAELYRIADLSHVWVMTDIFEKDRDFVTRGGIATIRYRGHELHARMSDALPQFDPQSRTLKTRFELDNPGNLLRPDMFVDVEIEANTPSAIVVPADAVVDSGRRKTVFVECGSGVYEPRPVETGWRVGDRVQITKGLEPGERIVTAGNFLIDSESRMRLAAVSSVAVAVKIGVKDPVCGMDTDPKSADSIKAQYGGKAYYFCSDQCKRAFEANPEKYIPRKSLAQDHAGEPGA